MNITLSARVLTLMDNYASEYGETRSGLIAEVAIEILRHGEEKVV